MSIYYRVMRLKIARCALLLLVGCESAPVAPVTTRPAIAPLPVAEQRSLLIHLPGIGGELWIDRSLVRGLMKAKVADNSEIYDWTGVNRGLIALGAINDNLKQARVVSEMITEYRRKNPDAKIVITSHSGGTGVAAWMLERLPEDVQIDEWVLLCSALSPGYDLSKALKHVKGHAYSFYSQYDSDVLKTGTELFGTIDRVKGESAGLIGFKTDQVADPAQYQKLTQYPYQQAWMQYGNDGGHVGPMNAAFGEFVVAPLLK